MRQLLVFDKCDYGHNINFLRKRIFSRKFGLIIENNMSVYFIHINVCDTETIPKQDLLIILEWKIL